MKICFLVTVAATLVLGSSALYRIMERECPIITKEQFENRVCTSDDDCTRTQKCCFTACEDWRHDCAIGDTVYRHFDSVPTSVGIGEGKCGYCYCLDGNVTCTERRCRRPGDPIILS